MFPGPFFSTNTTKATFDVKNFEKIHPIEKEHMSESFHIVITKHIVGNL